MSYKFKTVELSKVYLDNINPRHDPIDNEPAIIEFLIAKEQVRPLAEHIAKRGLNPLKRMAVVESDKVKGSYISLEGNRRFCALKLLADPAKAGKAGDRKALAEAAKLAQIPKKIEVAVFGTREEGREWLELEHGGEQGGRGTRKWSAPQKARFSRQGTGDTQQVQASLLIDYARNRKLLPPEDAASLKITTLTRYLSNPTMRDVLGLNDNKTLSIIAPQEEFDRAASRFLRDALNGPSSGVHSRTDVKERVEYAHQLRRENVATTSRLLAAVELDASTGRPVGMDAAAVAKRLRDNLSPDKRKHVIPPDFTAHIKDKVLKRLYDELKLVDAEHCAFAATYLYRAFIEQLTKVYLKSHRLAEGGDLHVKIGRMADDIVAKGKKQGEVKVLRVMADNRDSATSPETLGAFIHGGLIPNRSLVNKAWDASEDIVKNVLPGLK